MNRDEKAAVIDAMAGELEASQAVFAVDYRGITVSQVADLRAQLRDGGRDLPRRQELADRARRRQGGRRGAEGAASRARPR